jgi:hypothetical protein
MNRVIVVHGKVKPMKAKCHCFGNQEKEIRNTLIKGPDSVESGVITWFFEAKTDMTTKRNKFNIVIEIFHALL